MDGRSASAMGVAALAQDERDALDRLDRVHGAGGMKAALLAMLLVPDQPTRVRAWREETSLVGEAETIRADIELLSGATRLPWFELLLARLGGTPLADRQELLRSARRLLTAAHPGLPIDRLLWLAMRRHFGENPFGIVHAPADADIAQLPMSDMQHVAHYTAHLARMVPSDDAQAGQHWYTAVMGRWMAPQAIPAWHRPDVDELVRALTGLQALSWMQRPQLVRAWVGEALPSGRPGPLPGTAADALRLSCLLMDSPMPPELARQYVEITPV
jgi:hypothetical protein